MELEFRSRQRNSRAWDIAMVHLFYFDTGSHTACLWWDNTDQCKLWCKDHTCVAGHHLDLGRMSLYNSWMWGRKPWEQKEYPSSSERCIHRIQACNGLESNLGNPCNVNLQVSTEKSAASWEWRVTLEYTQRGPARQVASQIIVDVPWDHNINWNKWDTQV